MRKKSIFFAGIIVCLFILAATGFYWYQKPRAGLINVTPAYTIQAKELYTAFQQNEQKANKQFLEKVIIVIGTVDNIQGSDTTINILLRGADDIGGINCSIAKGNETPAALPKKGTIISVKGKCVGFLMDVNLVDAVIEP